MSVFDGAVNVGSKAARRLTTLHKPLVRMFRRRQRAQEHAAFERDAAAIDRRIADIAGGGGPIVAGPWLAEVGYEVLYWIPFLRWFADTFQVGPSRLVVISRGGMERLYAPLADRYVDLFDALTPQQLAARNAERQASREGGGQKQSDISPFDDELLRQAADTVGAAGARVLHPSLMFRMFRHAWHGNIPMDVFWNRTRYERITLAGALPAGVTLPDRYTAVKLYTGPALTRSEATRDAVRRLVAHAAGEGPVIAMSTRLGLDDHDDFDLSGIPGVIDAHGWMTPRTNLALQLSIVAGAHTFLSTCGGLAWLAPFLGVPTVAVYDNDQLLAPHLLVERQAGKRAGAAEFSTLDLRALTRARLMQLERPALQ